MGLEDPVDDRLPAIGQRLGGLTGQRLHERLASGHRPTDREAMPDLRCGRRGPVLSYRPIRWVATRLTPGVL